MVPELFPNDLEYNTITPISPTCWGRATNDAKVVGLAQGALVMRCPVRIVKQGEENGQGVGYLDDGTMIVVEGGRPYVNHEVRIDVTSVLQTSAGRMIFGRFEEQTEKND